MKSYDENLKNDPIKARESQLHAYITEKYNISDRIFQHESCHFLSATLLLHKTHDNPQRKLSHLLTIKLFTYHEKNKVSSCRFLLKFRFGKSDCSFIISSTSYGCEFKWICPSCRLPRGNGSFLVIDKYHFLISGWYSHVSFLTDIIPQLCCAPSFPRAAWKISKLLFCIQYAIRFRG